MNDPNGVKAAAQGMADHFGGLCIICDGRMGAGACKNPLPVEEVIDAIAFGIIHIQTMIRETDRAMVQKGHPPGLVRAKVLQLALAKSLIGTDMDAVLRVTDPPDGD